jgi:hypothetical protein
VLWRRSRSASDTKEVRRGLGRASTLRSLTERGRSSPGSGDASADERSAAPSACSVRSAPGGMPRPLAAELVQRARSFAPSALREQHARAVRLGAELRKRELECEPERQQSLLGAVVEVALESPTLLVARGDDACPRCAELDELRAQLGLQALVLEGESCGRAWPRIQERASFEQRRIVNERSGRVPAAGRGTSPLGQNSAAEARTGGRRHRRRSRAVGGARARASDRRGVRASASRTDTGRRVLELDDQVGDARTRTASPQESGCERERDAERRDRHDPETSRRASTS